ncbi:MAG: hypothetical protein RL240_989, partial [Planctomycetota bacterium]
MRESAIAEPAIRSANECSRTEHRAPVPIRSLGASPRERRRP